LSKAPVARPLQKMTRIYSQAGVAALLTKLRPKSAAVKQTNDTRHGSQTEPARRTCNQPTIKPPDPKPTLVGMRTEPAIVGPRPRTASTKTGA